MQEFKTKVWLPEDTELCDNPERCRFLLGCYCILLGKILATRDNIPVKDYECPAFPE